MNEIDWRPTASLSLLRQRAEILNRIRIFFAERDVLEVETPLLSHATVTDPHILSMTVPFKNLGTEKEEICYLQTSPEYAMKRLLAAGSGSIFQITKAFRQGEVGRLHNPEFSLLEWYRLGYDHHALMDEMDELLQAVLQLSPAIRKSTAEVYQEYLGINPHTITNDELRECAKQYINPMPNISNEKNNWLDLLFSNCIEPHLVGEVPFFIYDFPVSQAALAKIRQENPPVASRFEMYFKGVELANGFHELQNAKEQRQRFVNDLAYRKQYHLPSVPMDEQFLAALQYGLPDCAGVALGLDRLILLVCDQKTIGEAISFGFVSVGG